MRIVRTRRTAPADERGASAAIGNFDGVHLGHQAVIDLARRDARRRNAPLGIVTFEPHPREVFAPDAPPFRLMNPAARASRLEKLGVQTLFELPFDAALYGLDAEPFAQKILADELGLSHVVVGQDFCFGRARLGNAEALKQFGARMGFGVTVADLLEIEAAGGPVSSTRIRTALSEGRPRDARAMLGHWHRIEGPVLHGEKRGRTLGYPTANMDLSGLHPPRHGVYAVLVDILTGPHAGSHTGVASLGVRPMFGVNTPNLETFLFDFSGDLYGAVLSVGLVAFLRPELRFDELDALVAQMERDSAEAREILAEA